MVSIYLYLYIKRINNIRYMIDPSTRTMFKGLARNRHANNHFSSASPYH